MGVPVDGAAVVVVPACDVTVSWYPVGILSREVNAPGAAIPDGNAPMPITPNLLVAVSSIRPSWPLTASRSTKDFIGLLAAAATLASVAVPRLGTMPLSASVDESVPPCCIRPPAQGRASVSARSVGGGQMFAPPAVTAASARPVSLDGATNAMDVEPLADDTVPPVPATSDVVP